MKIKLENMENITIDIGRDIIIQRYRHGLIIMNTDTNSIKEIKFGDLGETIASKNNEQ